MAMGTSHKNIVIFGIGIGLVIIGLALGIYSPLFFNSLSGLMLQLTPSSDSFKLWVRTPVPLYLDVYLFNWTNVADSLHKSAKPHFEEIGPFIFKEEHERIGITWNDNHTVTYNQTRKWNFVPEESRNLSIEITNLNVILTTVSKFLKNQSKKTIPSFILDHIEKLSVTSPAKNWLFEGINDPLLDIIKLIERFLNISILAANKFGWFYQRNMSSSYDGMFTIKTGTDDIYNLGIMDRWNHVNKTKYYKNECALVNGSSGELFPPMTHSATNLTFFISDICSSITLNRSKTESVKKIDSYSFVGVENTLDNGQLSPENKCFCGEKCIPYGARDVTACRGGAPLFFSFPHFYLADESYTNHISGMKPNKSEHEFKLLLDPLTGIPTRVRAQLQINVHLEPVPGLKMFEDVPDIFVPMMWFRQRAEVTPKLVSQIKLFHSIPIVVTTSLYVVAAIGLIVILLRVIIICLNRHRRSLFELLLPPKSKEETSGSEE